MQHNILRDSDVIRIFLFYTEKGVKKKFPVKLRFMDNKECYFAADFYQNFEKPKRKTPVSIIAYTSDGVYSTEVILKDTVMSMNNILFEVSLPVNWHFKQMRQSTRVCHELPFTIKFNDGSTIEGVTYDISVGGISFISKEKYSSIYKKIPGRITMRLSSDVIISTGLSDIDVETRFVREQANIDDYEKDRVLYVWKFVNLSQEQQEFIKSYIICLN